MTTATFRGKNQALQNRAVEILDAERPMTLRGLYYRLISAGALANSRKEYDRLKRVMTRLRESGDVPVTGWLVDRVRSTLKPSSWSGLASFGDTVARAYRKDLWAQMPHHIEVFVEKDAIAGTIQPVTEEYNVALNIIRGDVSVSFADEVAGLWAKVRKPIYAYYLGDCDPSGFGIEKVLRDKLTRYSGRPVLTSGAAKSTLGRVPSPDRNVYWQRLAVGVDDFAAFDLIRLPVKRSNPRAAEFIRLYGNDCAEVDALPPTELRRRVQAAIESHIDQARWHRLQHVEELERNSVSASVTNWISGIGAGETDPRAGFATEAEGGGA